MAVRIEELKPLQVEREIKTGTVWFENHNIQECIAATEKFKIENIHLQTNTIDFLNDPRLKNIKGITIQFDIGNIEPLYNFPELTHLGLSDDIKDAVDFSKFRNLIYLGGSLHKKSINLNQLTNLKYTYLFGYNERDFKTFSNFKNLTGLTMFFTNVESLNGLLGLENLTQINLENCPKLASLDGIGSGNANLEKVSIANCKRLSNANALINVPNLKYLLFYKIPALQSLSFLNELNNLEDLYIHPTNVGVKNDDYYPLVDTLKRIDKLEILKGWKRLKDYLAKKVVIEKYQDSPASELQLIKNNLGIKDWAEKRADGLKQYSLKNCKAAEAIIISLINQLDGQELNLVDKTKLIEKCILVLNKFNDSLGGSFIETEEREELCDIFDNIADVIGINVQDYPDGIASKWRTW